MAAAKAITVGRVYDQVAPGEGRRVLVDRLWPRGLGRGDARIGLWLPEIAPSADLRRWYGHRDGRFDEFRERYLAELASPEAAPALERLTRLAESSALLLTTATREADRSHAAVLLQRLR